MKQIFFATIFTTLPAAFVHAQSCPDPVPPAAGGTATVIEIVAFRLVPDISEEDFIAAAQATLDYLCKAPGFVGRTMSRDATGLWTDHVLWADLASAVSAMAASMDEPVLQPFMAAIDPATMTLRHAGITALE